MNLDYFCQRYYDPEIGRFMEIDPQDSPGYSRYAYCGNNPLIMTVPMGERMDYEHSLMAGALQTHGGWKAGRPSYVFYEYDEYSNLTGMDYYDPYSANNPYLENKIIPPAEYYSVMFKPPKGEVPSGLEGSAFTDADILKAMRAVYIAAVFGGGMGRMAILGYAGTSLYWGSTSFPNMAFGETHREYGAIEFASNYSLTLAEFLNTIVHEGLHAGPRHADYGDYVHFFTEPTEEFPVGGVETRYRTEKGSAYWWGYRIQTIVGPDLYKYW